MPLSSITHSVVPINIAINNLSTIEHSKTESEQFQNHFRKYAHDHTTSPKTHMAEIYEAIYSEEPTGLSGSKHNDEIHTKWDHFLSLLHTLHGETPSQFKFKFVIQDDKKLTTLIITHNKYQLPPLQFLRTEFHRHQLESIKKNFMKPTETSAPHTSHYILNTDPHVLDRSKAFNTFSEATQGKYIFDIKLAKLKTTSDDLQTYFQRDGFPLSMQKKELSEYENAYAEILKMTPYHPNYHLEEFSVPSPRKLFSIFRDFNHSKLDNIKDHLYDIFNKQKLDNQKTIETKENNKTQLTTYIMQLKEFLKESVHKGRNNTETHSPLALINEKTRKQILELLPAAIIVYNLLTEQAENENTQGKKIARLQEYESSIDTLANHDLRIDMKEYLHELIKNIRSTIDPEQEAIESIPEYLKILKSKINTLHSFNNKSLLTEIDSVKKTLSQQVEFLYNSTGLDESSQRQYNELLKTYTLIDNVHTKMTTMQQHLKIAMDSDVQKNFPLQNELKTLKGLITKLPDPSLKAECLQICAPYNSYISSFKKFDKILASHDARVLQFSTQLSADKKAQHYLEISINDFKKAKTLIDTLKASNFDTNKCQERLLTAIQNSIRFIKPAITPVGGNKTKLLHLSLIEIARSLNASKDLLTELSNFNSDYKNQNFHFDPPSTQFA